MPQPKSKRRPTDAVTVTRERLEAIVDDAVRRGRMTRSDATDLITEILTRSRSTTEDIVDRARRATGLGPSFPISNYEGMTAAEVQSRLDKLSRAELRKVRDYERRNANRKTVLATIESKLEA